MKLVERISALALIILFLALVISCDQNVTNPGRMKSQNDKAIAVYNKVIELNPRDAEAYNDRGLAYSESGFSGPSSLCATPGQCLRLAIKDFDQAIRINPDYAMAYINRGNSYFYSGKMDSACADWRMACRLGFCEELNRWKNDLPECR